MTVEVSKNSEDSILVLPNPIPVTSGLVETKTWVGVAKKHILTKQEFVVSEVNGRQRVVVPKGVFEGAKPLWEDFLIGKFLNASAPHVGKIHMVVNKIWRLGDKSSLIDVYAVNDTTVKFRIRKEAMRIRFISKWTPFAEETQPAMRSIPLWVRLKNVPPSMYTDKGLEFLSSAVGKPIRLHPKTEACVSFEEAHILVEADLTKDLPIEYHLTGEEEGELDAVINYSYPWLPPRCSNCQKWGHEKDTCLAGAGGNNVVSHESSNLTKAKDIETGNKDTSMVSPLVVEIEKDKTITVQENLQENKDKLADEEDGNMKEGGTEEDWITPLNPGRSPGKKTEGLKYGEVSILANTYSVLSEQDGEEEENEAGTSSEAEQKEEPLVPENNDGKTENALDRNGNKPYHTRGQKPDLPPRHSLPRFSKNSHKYLATPSTQSTRTLTRGQSISHPQN